MRLVACSVLDSKAGHFSRPVFSVAVGEALRGFQLECQNPESMLNRFPGDFRLFLVGAFNQVTGELEVQVPVEIGTALDFVGRSNPVEVTK